MVHTLRITSVLAAALAIALISFSAAKGFKRDVSVEELLESPPMLEQLASAAGQRKVATNPKESSLVIQAKKFADHLEPPIKTSQNVSIGSRGQVRTPPPPPPAPPSTFTVQAISYSAKNPQLSRALINETGDGQRWIRLEDQIGHHHVTEIKRDRIVLSNGQEQQINLQPRLSLSESRNKLNGGQAALPKTNSAITSSVSRGQTIAAQANRGAYNQSRALQTMRARDARTRAYQKRPTEATSQADQLDELNRKMQDLAKIADLDEDGKRAQQEVMEKLQKIHSDRLSQQETRSMSKMGDLLERARSGEPNIIPDGPEEGGEY